MDRQAFCNPVQSESSNISDSLSTTTLLNMLQIERPKFAIKIKGEVLAIQSWPNELKPIYLFGEIGDSETCIEFKIKPTTKLLLRGQHIEILGTLHTSTNYQRDGIKISIEGEMTSEYKVENRVPKLLHQNLCRPQQSLRLFLTNYNFNQLCILSTRHGFADFIANTNQTVHHTDVVFSICNFDTTENIIKGIKEASSKQKIKGIAIIHDGVNCWDNRKWDNSDVVLALLDTKLHFYTALCETETLLLADKHADESFITPNDIARHLTALVIENRQKDAITNKVLNIESKFHSIITSRIKLKKIILLLAIGNITLLGILIIKLGNFN